MERAPTPGRIRGIFFPVQKVFAKMCVFIPSPGSGGAWLGDVCDSEQFQGTTCQTGWASLGRPHQGACLLGHGCPLTHAGLAVGSQSPRSRRRPEGPCGRSPFGSFRPVHMTRCLSRTIFSFPRGLHELRATRGRAINICGTVWELPTRLPQLCPRLPQLPFSCASCFVSLAHLACGSLFIGRG